MTVYQSIEQEEGWNGRLFVRAHQDAYALVPAISQTIHEMSADQPVENASTLGDVRAEVLTPDRLNAIVFGGFAAVTLLILLRALLWKNPRSEVWSSAKRSVIACSKAAGLSALSISCR
jgi:hypothetical protein